MIDVRPFNSLGRFENEWLNARHHFSFGGYRDSSRMGFGRLRVWNDDEIAPGTGFDPHPHRDMEIITYIREGAITHRDNLGNEGRTEAGDVQVMHAGTGIVHAEMNLEPIPTRLFQIWIMPDKTGVAPGWGTRQFPRAGDGLRLLASGQAGADDALPLNADASVWAGSLAAGAEVRHVFGPGRGGYLVPINGALTVDGVVVGPRDGVAISALSEVTIAATEAVELVLVDITV
jgi:redox-sensitive bicupin YhaK (pirin superfamily)